MTLIVLVAVAAAGVVAGFALGWQARDRRPTGSEIIRDPFLAGEARAARAAARERLIH